MTFSFSAGLGITNRRTDPSGSSAATTSGVWPNAAGFKLPTARRMRAMVKRKAPSGDQNVRTETRFLPPIIILPPPKNKGARQVGKEGGFSNHEQLERSFGVRPAAADCRFCLRPLAGGWFVARACAGVKKQTISRRDAATQRLTINNSCIFVSFSAPLRRCAR